MIIATPIGNIKEISEAAITAFKENKNFFCEDTRVLKKLFNLLDISINNKNFFALNAINENNIVTNFNFRDEVYCLTSDAGYPMLSDPGYFLINHFIKSDWKIEVINGPSALMHALVISGYKTNNFLFYGFLNHNKNQKEQELISLKKEEKTIVIYESIHRIKETLNLIKKIFSDDVDLVVCRELTKANETIYRGSIQMIIDSIVEKGEIVIVLNNNKENDKKKVIDFNDYYIELKSLINKGEKEKVACKIVAYKYNLKSGDLYSFWQEKKNNI